jgi:predicted dehydrogenase
MRTIVVGLGVQGHKRSRFAGLDFVAAVDPYNAEAQYRSLDDIPPDAYEAALVCAPDDAKIGLLTHLLGRGKHVLVEKPLIADDESELLRLQSLARSNNAVCYVAYNHRFEPHFVRMRDLVASGALGRIYRCRMFYGNGTARLVRNSDWRDSGAGVLDDLGSHLLDTARFWFGDIGDEFELISARCFENKAPDHVAFGVPRALPQLEFEMTLLSWRNNFTCDVFAEHGSAHIRSLCKWGPSEFVRRIRVLPSGRPPEETVTLVEDDPTWAAEYAHFEALCRRRAPADLTNDIWLNRVLKGLGEKAMQQVRQ